MRICIVEGCDEKHRAKGYCILHWRKWRRNGDPLFERYSAKPEEPDTRKIWDQMDIVWVAGIIEGEGTIEISMDRYVRVAVRMTDKDVIDSLYEKLCIGTVTGPETKKEKKHHKPTWLWRVSDIESVSRLLLAVYPLMHERRSARITEAVEAINNRMNTRWCPQCGDRFTTFLEDKIFCKRNCAKRSSR